MPCLLALLAYFFPRLVLIILFLTTSYLGKAYQTTLWPLLGFFFMPLTTLAYAFGFNSNGGNITGIYLVFIVLAVLIDLGVLGHGAQRTKTVMTSGRINR